tara:strand:+ start:1088 stop:1483 length:396 start_codon:yes stop_codon:yes gene_type:complete
MRKIGNLNSDTNRVYFYINLRLKSDIDVAEQWIKDRSAKYVFELKEEKGISFEWFLSDDNTEATLIESYVDSDGAKQRIENHAASPIATEVLEHFDITGFHVFGNAKKDLIEMLIAWGAKFNRFAGGFNHS